MDLNKMLKRKERSRNEKNQQAAEACSKLGDYYMNEGTLDKALEEFREAGEIFRSISMRMEAAKADRMKGEVYMKLMRYQDALKCVKSYLKVSKEENNLVEIQRAHTTLGRCYLMIAEDRFAANGNVGDVITNDEDFKAAEREFLKGLLACKDLGKLVPKYEVADMKARIYFNLGMLSEHKSCDDAVEKYETAVKICKSNDLYEIHHTTLMALGYCYGTKKNNSIAALHEYNNALEIAELIRDNKNEKMCETLLAKGTLLIKNGDFQSAKQTLKKAYKLKTSIECDRVSIQKQFKIVNALCKSEDELITTDSFDYAKKKELYEKLGDFACKLKNYIKAIDWYGKMLEAAELDGEIGKKLIPIYVSLYETYIDAKDYENALKFLHLEHELIKDVPKEACMTLLRLGNVLELAKKDFWDIEGTYRKALAAARLVGDSTIEKNVLRKLISLCNEHKMTSLAEIFAQEALEKNIDISPIDVESEENEYSEDIGMDDDFLELSTDAESSDENNDTIVANNGKSTSVAVRNRKKRSMTVKKNVKGETRLHEACISGNYQLAKMLIEQGHAVNVRDNAGWLPLHEAANHGHRDIVELLIDHGASINDRGGTKCEGISPIYDAACNGHLRVIQLLLDRGAKATIKTDANETPLDGLRRWYENEDDSFSDTQKNLYDDISGRLVDQCERIGIDTKVKSKSLLPSSIVSSGYGSLSQRRRFDTNFSDDSNESDTENNDDNSNKEIDSKKAGKNAGEVYKNVMKSLKNPYRERKCEDYDTVIETKKRSAFLAEAEVEPDDWLVDDVGPLRKKQKFFSEGSLKASKSKEFQESSPQKVNRINVSESNNVTFDSEEEANNKEISDYDDNTLDAFDVLMNAEDGGINVKRKPRRNSQTKLSQNKNQSSLFDAGFSRFIDVTGDLVASPSRSSLHNSSLNMSGSAGEKQTTQIIKVQIGDEKIIVPIYQDAANVNSIKISWLIEEAAKRYYSLKGIRPELKLKTADGATLLESDTLSVILCLKEENLIFSEVLDWKLPSLSNRYLEACSELKCGADSDINDLLDLGRATVSLDLSNQNLRPSTVRPILKALQHQACLSQLDLSSNFIQDEGTKYLSQTLITLRQLTVLDLSCNAITEMGVEHLCNALIKSTLPAEIKSLKLNFNPIKTLNYVAELCRNKSVSSLSLVGCELTTVKDSMLNSLRELDVSFNHLTHSAVKEILFKLNPAIIERVNLERCSEDASMGETIVNFIVSSSASLKELNLSGLNFKENEILDILRSLEGCKNLRNLDLSYQKELSFISLKYILFNICNQSLVVNLKGCRNLQNVANLFSHQQCLQSSEAAPTHLPCQVLLSIPQATFERERNDYIGKMRDLWNGVTAARGITQIERNTLRLNIENLE